MEENKGPLVNRFFHACLLVLGGVLALWFAAQLLAQVWGWLLLIAGIVGLAVGTVWIARFWRKGRW